MKQASFYNSLQMNREKRYKAQKIFDRGLTADFLVNLHKRSLPAIDECPIFIKLLWCCEVHCIEAH